MHDGPRWAAHMSTASDSVSARSNGALAAASGAKAGAMGAMTSASMSRNTTSRACPARSRRRRKACPRGICLAGASALSVALISQARKGGAFARCRC